LPLSVTLLKIHSKSFLLQAQWHYKNIKLSLKDDCFTLNVLEAEMDKNSTYFNADQHIRLLPIVFENDNWKQM